MSSNTIVNGAPMTISRGVQDVSTRVPAIEPEVIPTHLPKVYIFAQKGSTANQLVVGNGRNQMYGDATFDEHSEFATHQTVLSNRVNAQGNAQMMERVIPKDAGPKANFLLSLDVLPTLVPQYKRGTDGKLLLNADTGLAELVTPAVSLPGFKAKWVLTSVLSKGVDDTDATLFGVAAQTPGDQHAGEVQSVRYPILQHWADAEGEYYNNSGFRIWAPTESSAGGVNERFMTSNKAYPFRMAAVRRATAASSPKIVETEDGSTSFDFTFVPGQINPITTAQFSLEDIFLKQYQLTEDVRFAPKYADLNGLHVYQDNINELLDMFYTAEKAVVGVDADWSGADDEAALFNFLGGVSSKDVPYYTYVLDQSSANAVRLSEGTSLFAKGGSNGTMNNAVFGELVSEAVSEYANPNSHLMDSAVQVESIIYDSGFPLATKYALCKFIAERKDTAVILSTYDVDDGPLTAAEDHSIAVALRTMLQMFPESDYFGTPVMRGLIVGRNGKLRNSLFTKRLPLTIELAVMAAKMMGAGDGKWKPAQLFDKAPNNIITMFDDVNITFTPATQRNKDWDVGLNYVLSFSRKQHYFPALKTVYDNDTSILNSFFAMMACVELQKVGERVHRQFSGSTALTNAQLIDRVNKKVEELTVGRFAGMFQVVPAAFISDGDEQRGYSWTLPIKLYGNGAKTVMTLDIQAHRMSDYVAA